MSQPWLRDLEEKVQEAAGRLRELKEENSVERERAREELFNDLNVELYRQLKVCLRLY